MLQNNAISYTRCNVSSMIFQIKCVYRKNKFVYKYAHQLHLFVLILSWENNTVAKILTLFKATRIYE